MSRISRFRVSEVYPELAAGGWAWALAGLGVTLALSMGVAYSPILATVPFALVALGVMFFAPIHVGLFLLILFRTLSDSALLPANASSLINVGIAGLALTMVLIQLTNKNGQTKPSAWAYGTLAGLFIFTLVGVASYGPQAEMLGDSLRLVSVIAITALAGIAVKRHSAERVGELHLWASAPAALLTAFGFVTHNSLFFSATTGRAFGTFAHPVAAAGYFSIVAIVSLFMLLEYRKRASLILFALFALAAVGTSSLGGLLTLAVGMGVLLLLMSRKTPGRTTVIVGVLSLGTLALVLVGQTVIDRIAGLSDTDLFAEVGQAGATNSTTWRFRNWLALLQYWQERPILGWGYGATTSHIRPLGELPHSGPVKLLVETGTVGFALAVIAIVILAVGATKRLRSSERNSAALQLAVLAAAVTNSLSSNTLTYIPMLIAIGVAWTVGNSRSDGSSPTFSSGLEERSASLSESKSA